MKIDGVLARGGGTKGGREVGERHFGHACLIADIGTLVVQAKDAVLLVSVRGMDLEEGHIRVSLLEPGETSALAREGAVKGCQAEVFALQLTAKPSLASGEGAVVLSYVKTIDELAGDHELQGNAASGTRTPTP